MKISKTHFREQASFERKKGSALVESCLVIALLCLILFGILQVVYMVAARNVINYSAVATARSASIGLNKFMLFKVSRYTTIPTAGPARTPYGLERIKPEGDSMGSQWSNAISRKRNPSSALGQYEVGVYQSYHQSGIAAHNLILDYDNWQREETMVEFSVEEDAKLDMIHVQVKQYIPLTLPLARVFFGHYGTTKAIRGLNLGIYPAKEMSAEVTIEDHAKLYLGPRDK